MTNLERIRILRALQLKAVRKENNVTQQQLKDLSGLSRATIVRLESGKSSCTQDSELLYLDALKNCKL